MPAALCVGYSPHKRVGEVAVSARQNTQRPIKWRYMKFMTLNSIFHLATQLMAFGDILYGIYAKSYGTSFGVS
jgi:hypothetical protein